MGEEEWDIALDNTNEFLGQTGRNRSIGTRRMSHVELEDLLNLRKKLLRILEDYNPLLKEISFKENEETAYYLGKIDEKAIKGADYVPYPNQFININPGHLRKSTDGNLYQISNGMTHKRTVDGQEYVGIENILIPAEVVFLHEVGHSLYREKRETITHKRVDRHSKQRKYSPLSGGGEYINSEDVMNIMGVSPVNENFFRKQYDSPLRYGYVSPSELVGGKVFYIKRDKVLRDVMMVAQLERGEGFRQDLGAQTWTDEELSQLTETPISIEFMEDAINVLPERGGGVDSNRLVKEFMNYHDIENFKKIENGHESISTSEGVRGSGKKWWLSSHGKI